MPAGIVATVDGGYATIDFVDQSLRGPALADLLEIGGPDSIETITRRGPRRQYRVLVGNAQAAGLLDGDEVGRVPSAGQDSGRAAALVAADPNVNAGGGENWHTPYDQHTSANAYVGDTTVTEARAAAAPVFTGTATPFGGTSAADTPTHKQVIEHVKEAGAAPSGAQAARGASADDVVLHHPGHQANAGLAAIQPYEPTDPQGATTLPNDLKAPVTEPETTEPEPLGGDGTETETQTGDDGDGAELNGDGLPTVKAYPEGEVSIDWKRPELDAYAADSPREIDTTDLPNKQAVFDAIVAREKELKT
jgi:hypothetical protein